MKQSNLFLFAALMVFAAAASRILLYPFNFSPIIAMALFSGAVIKDKRYAFILPLAAMLLSDVMFELFNIAPGFWGIGQVVNYAILAGITVLGFTMKKPGVLRIAGYSIASSLIFFFLSNASVWLFDVYYPSDFSGLVQSLTAGLPFLKTGIITDLVYCTILFGGYEILSRTVTQKSVA